MSTDQGEGWKEEEEEGKKKQQKKTKVTTEISRKKNKKTNNEFQEKIYQKNTTPRTYKDKHMMVNLDLFICYQCSPHLQALFQFLNFATKIKMK
jgi:hypothetical protein